jgi:putative nucleotidyltransferase with HDIG domain
MQASDEFALAAPTEPVMNVEQHFVSPEQLCLGLFIHLDLGWMDHPFTFSSFLIKTDDQIEIIRKLGLPRIRYEPAKSTAGPAPVAIAVKPAAEPAAATLTLTVEEAAALATKKARNEQLARIKRHIVAVELEFKQTADSIKAITRSVSSQPREAHQQATRLVDAMVENILSKADVMLHAMSEKLGDDVYFHSLNVTILSLILSRALGFDGPALREVGMGALFHDLGKAEIPKALVVRQEPLSKTEQLHFEQHTNYGLNIAKKLGLSEAGQHMVLQHHEYMDGSGYPGKLVGEQISPFARVVAIANTYDNLCNPTNPASALTPSEALSRMFALMRAKLDELQLQVFIRCLGVYPPGSIVQLSNDMIGLVVSGNSAQPMRPNVLVYAEDVPKDDAVIVSLDQEPEIKIAKSLRPSQLTREIYQYLNPRKRVTYYFDPVPQQGCAS